MKNLYVPQQHQEHDLQTVRPSVRALAARALLDADNIPRFETEADLEVFLHSSNLPFALDAYIREQNRRLL
jgi:hypothetical protein